MAKSTKARPFTGYLGAVFGGILGTVPGVSKYLHTRCRDLRQRDMDTLDMPRVGSMSTYCKDLVISQTRSLQISKSPTSTLFLVLLACTLGREERVSQRVGCDEQFPRGLVDCQVAAPDSVPVIERLVPRLLRSTLT